MARRSPLLSEDDDVLVSSRRKKQKVNYAQIENNYDDLDELEEELPADVGFEAEDAPVDELTVQPAKKRVGSDDESFNEEEVSEEFQDEESDEFEDEFLKQERSRRERQFVSKDDDEDGEYDYNPKGNRTRSKNNRRMLRKSGSRNSRRVAATPENSEDDEEDLQAELAGLKNSSDDGTPKRARDLRQRTKEVNYLIPPPLPANLDGLAEPQSQRSLRRRNNNASAIRRLFPTGGPFGGGDVTSIFGKNYGGLNNTTGNLLAGADSDSSDDEIVPLGGNKRSSISAPVGAAPGKAKKKDIADTDPLGVDMNVDFSSIGGLENYINQLKEMVVLPLLYPEVYQRFGITPPRGVLFHGPPGTGKTLMARALAASCSTQGQKITFFMRKGADCLSKWVGEAERQLRLLFEEAKKQQPSIIFFDEIDGLAPVRSSKQEQIHASIVSTMLALMDGMDNRGQVIVIGATNRPDAVDPALRRPGRFDREFYFPLPEINARAEILKIHTKKWDPPLAPQFLDKVAHLTKGYGGADLRALCTEAALNSIQRRYPQIYQSNDKLKIDPSTIHVAARDFMRALDKIVPSSARSAASGSAPLPTHVASLLKGPLAEITAKLDKVVPRVKKLTALQEAEYADPTEDDEDGGFAKHELIKRLESSRIHRPRLLISGVPGNGQQYLGAAVLNHLEGFNVQSLDLGTLFGDSTRTAENAIIQSFVEAKRHTPSIIFIPNVDIWYDTVPESAKSTLAGLLRSVSSNERILLLGVSDTPYDELDQGLRLLFGLTDIDHVNLGTPDKLQRKEFFKPLFDAVKMAPTEFLDNREKKPLEILEKIEIVREEAKPADLKSFEKHDMKLKNTLKIKLSGLMDLFKNRYRKFKKPPIDDFQLVHLFDENFPTGMPALYTREGDMIVELASARKFYNMDLDIIEERLWNGFYSEPKQFLKDIEMIYLDSVTLNDRERLIKASEMYANAQVGVEEISNPEFVEQCKALRRRELQRIKEFEERAKLRITTDNGNQSLMVSEEPDPVDVEIVPHVDSETDSADGPEPEAEHEEALYEEPPATGPVIQKQIVKETPRLIVDEDRLGQLEETLIQSTEGWSVEMLEEVNAVLMDTVWDERHSWDRKDMLELINGALSRLFELAT